MTLKKVRYAMGSAEKNYERQFVKISEAVKLTGEPERAIRAWIDAKEIAWKKLPHRPILVDLNSIEALHRKSTHGAGRARPLQ